MSSNSTLGVSHLASTETPYERAISRAKWRIIPFLFLCFVLNYIDRTNVGFAKLHFQATLKFDDAIFGFGISMFFLGYLLFEVPSNLLLARIGTRKTLARIMVLWGIASIATMFVRTPNQFYVVRFLVGVFEAGFVPGIILYLSYWFDARQRAQTTSFFMLALPISGVISNPVSGWIMSRMDMVWGLDGWQWLFIIEGIPSIGVGIFAFFYLVDKPTDATWLSPAEKSSLIASVEKEVKVSGDHSSQSIFAVMRDVRVYLFAFAVFTQFCAVNVLTYWGPTLLRGTGITDVWHIGILGALPLIVGAVGMVLVAKSSDKFTERRWHTFLSQLLTVIALFLLPKVTTNVVLLVMCLTVLSVGYFSFWSVFWSIPPAYFSKNKAPIGIALISSLGATGGIFASNLIGSFRTSAGGMSASIYIIAALTAIGAVLFFASYKKGPSSPITDRI